MDAKSCEYEEEVIKATISGIWSAEISAHRNRCQVCEQSAALTNELSGLEISSEPMSPGIIWWKHELRLRRLRLDESLRPIQRFQRIGLPLAVVLLFGMGMTIIVIEGHQTSSFVSTIVLTCAAALILTASVTLLFLLRYGRNESL